MKLEISLFAYFHNRALVCTNSVHGNFTHGFGILKFFLLKEYKNEFIEIYTYIGGGQVPAG